MSVRIQNARVGQSRVRSDCVCVVCVRNEGGLLRLTGKILTFVLITVCAGEKTHVSFDMPPFNHRSRLFCG